MSDSGSEMDNAELFRLNKSLDIDPQLLDIIRRFPVERVVTCHCGARFAMELFGFHATCPKCGLYFKVRNFAADTYIEDVFDAVFEWLMKPGAADVCTKRQQQIREDS